MTEMILFGSKMFARFVTACESVTARGRGGNRSRKDGWETLKGGRKRANQEK